MIIIARRNNATIMESLNLRDENGELVESLRALSAAELAALFTRLGDEALAELLA